jgi:hypothetical protein
VASGQLLGKSKGICHSCRGEFIRPWASLLFDWANKFAPYKFLIQFRQGFFYRRVHFLVNRIDFRVIGDGF